MAAADRSAGGLALSRAVDTRDRARSVAFLIRQGTHTAQLTDCSPRCFCIPIFVSASVCDTVDLWLLVFQHIHVPCRNAPERADYIPRLLAVRVEYGMVSPSTPCHSGTTFAIGAVLSVVGKKKVTISRSVSGDFFRGSLVLDTCNRSNADRPIWLAGGDCICC